MSSKPIDVPTRETVEFIASHVRSRGVVLEIGCGDGDVASELLRRGYRVVGVDSNPEVVANAKARQLAVQLASWPDFEPSRLQDAVLFTRSLHHIEPLERAVVRAHNILKPQGKLIVEDFAFDATDDITLNWFAGVIRSDRAKALLKLQPDELVTDLLDKEDPLRIWRHRHNGHLHRVDTMSAAIAKRFKVLETLCVPYLYRYLVPVLAETQAATSFINSVFRDEQLAGTSGAIRHIGRRIVAVND